MEHSSLTDPRRKLLRDVLNSHWVLSLATSGEDGPYSTPLFYAVADDGETLIFMSKSTSNHVRHLNQDHKVSAGVYLETKEIGKIQGVQLCGIAECPVGDEAKRLFDIYCKVHPVALATKAIKSDTQLYAIRVSSAKLIDNKFGIGKPVTLEFDSGQFS